MLVVRNIRLLRSDTRPEELRRGIRKIFSACALNSLTQEEITMDNFSGVVHKCLRTCT